MPRGAAGVGQVSPSVYRPLYYQYCLSFKGVLITNRFLVPAGT